MARFLPCSRPPWRCLQELPGAEYLSRLQPTLASPTRAPRPEPMPPAELRTHMQTSAAALSLPPDIVPVCPPRTTTGACHVCNRDVEFDDVRLLCCGRCGVTVHTTCYCVSNHTPGESWLCEPCAAGIKKPPACALCPVLGGAMRFCKGGEWVHAACALWIPGVTMVPDELPDISSVRSAGRHHVTQPQCTSPSCLPSVALAAGAA